ncbi:MAG TPA: murein biosynthesis integral membrane protein MurJ [Candidatus Cloacimonadota bacterium]|nr:murein biosynthesis integral membrane protein MurJ [Candidatus Cloacimonadota bacterium]HPT71443.1 murein biosynthesis integral membrane protein MurJ [Candidatus Cloacimonadota bacterium]
MSTKKLARNVGMMSIAVFFSRIIGLIRDQIMAYYFGTTFMNDAFNVSFNIVNLLRRLFGEGALSAAFVPIYNEIGIKENKQAQIRFALNVLSILTSFLLALTLIGIVFAPIIVKIASPGLIPQTSMLAIKLCRIIFPYLFFIGLSSTMIAILNSHDYFFMTGLSSALWNIGMIATILIPVWLGPITRAELIFQAGWGVVFGGFLQTIINFPYLKRLGYNFKIIYRFSGEALRTMWRRFIPSMIGIGIREINLYADIFMASFLPVGSISALSFGNRLMQLPLGIFAIATGTAVLPLFSRYTTEKNWEGLSESLRFASISLAYIMLPVTAIIIALGQDFVHILFRMGQFDQRATIMTYKALAAYSLGLLFFSLNQTLTPVFYANKDTKTPVKIAAWMAALNITLNFTLMQFLYHMGLALATSITAIVNYIILMKHMKKQLPDVKYKDIWPNIAKISVLSVFILFILLGVNHFLSFESRFLLLLKDAVASGVCLILFAIGAHAWKVAYSDQIRNNLWQRFHRH